MRLLVSCLLMLSLTACSAPQSNEEGGQNADPVDPDASMMVDMEGVDADMTAPTPSVRIATFNASMFRDEAGALAQSLEDGEDAHAQQVAEIIQRVRPDILLINEFDWDDQGLAAQRFVDNYLATPQGDQEALPYPHRYVPATNTGLHSGIDLDNDEQVDQTSGSQVYAADAFGFGVFHGQYGMAIYSRYPIDTQGVRSFQELLWESMPEDKLPGGFYSREAIGVLRVSSKNHVDVPVDIDGHTLHLLASHPTPPAFDGPEDRNGKRNHDEIRLWHDYITGGEQAQYLTDDAGTAGGLGQDASFVILGDLNSDPVDGDSIHAGINDLLANPALQDPMPASDGAVAADERDGQANQRHEGDPRLDTADFSDSRVGNLRVDYVLPSADLQVLDAGVFWPTDEDPAAALTEVSDHHLVWVDVADPSQAP